MNEKKRSACVRRRGRVKGALPKCGKVEYLYFERNRMNALEAAHAAIIVNMKKMRERTWDVFTHRCRANQRRCIGKKNTTHRKRILKRLFL